MQVLHQSPDQSSDWCSVCRKSLDIPAQEGRAVTSPARQAEMVLPAEGRSGVGETASFEADATRDLHNIQEGRGREGWADDTSDGDRDRDEALTSSSSCGIASSGSTRPTAFRASSSS